MRVTRQRPQRPQRPQRSRRPRILCHVNHFSGSGSDFVGKSTRGSVEVRRAVVERVVAQLRELPFDMDVVVCGIPGQSLLPIDLDLSHVEDPRHLVYESISAMYDALGDHDFFLNIEDDIEITAATLRRCLRFARRNRVNEVLLPHRLELRPDAAPTPVDLEVIPGWTGTRRSYGSTPLRVAHNPHAGMFLLSREQMVYARRRCDLDRRERFLGGYMASAYANIHGPFLLWRTEDVEAHHVIHLDHWLGHTPDPGPGAAAGSPPRPEDAPREVRGYLDEASVDGLVVTVRGWALDASSAPLEPHAIRFGDDEVTSFTLTRHDRPDVREVHPGEGDDCGFTVHFSLLDVPLEGLDGERFGVLVADGDRSVALPTHLSWPTDQARRGLAAAPEVPLVPYMPDASIARITELLGRSRCYLEYGSGGSTLLAASMGVERIVCVESDASWMYALQHRLRQLGRTDAVELVHVDIGPTGDWGVPLSDAMWRQYHQYPLRVWNEVFVGSSSPDLVLIDGRFRTACLLASLLHARPGTPILVDDYDSRPEYHVVEEVAVPVRRHDRMAEFEVPQDPPAHQLWSLFARTAHDVL